MSKETEPVRSRRQLREAKSAQTNGAAGNPPAPSVPAPASPAPAGVAPAGAPPAPEGKPVPGFDPQGRGTLDPATPRPGIARPTAVQPGTGQPGTVRPGAGDAGAGEPMGAKPATGQAAAAQPVRAAAPPSAAPGNDAGAQAPRERSSQTRARDRAALRAYRELLDPVAAPADPLPSRRALRHAQLDAERAPITSINPVVPPAAGVPVAPQQSFQTPTVPVRSPSPPAAPTTSAAAAQATAAQETAAAAGQAPVASVPVVPAASSAAAPSTQTAPGIQGPTAQAAPARQRAGRRASAQAPDAKGPAAAFGTPTPSGQQARPVPAVPVVPPANVPGLPAPATAAPGVPPLPGPASPWLVEATAPRGGKLPPAPASTTPALGTAAPAAAVPGRFAQATAGPAGFGQTPAAQASNTQAASPSSVAAPNAYPATGSMSVLAPTSEDVRLLAEQRAQAERTAVLNQRAQTRERLLAESAKSRRAPADPTATNNLAMVTPLEFIEVPGLDRPVLRPPATTHVPIVTMSTPKLAPARRKGPAKSPEAERFDAALAARAAHRPGPGARPLTGGRSSTLKRAQEMATDVPSVAPGEITRTQMPPMPADYAHGLEPLDAVTAGLGRTQRNMLIQWGSIILGGAAIVVVAVLFITGLNH